MIEYLRAEYHEMILYASKPVILSVKTYIEHASRDNFLASVLAMRQDLWTGQHDMTVSEIALAKGDA